MVDSVTLHEDLKNILKEGFLEKESRTLKQWRQQQKFEQNKQRFQFNQTGDGLFLHQTHYILLKNKNNIRILQNKQHQNQQQQQNQQMMKPAKKILLKQNQIMIEGFIFLLKIIMIKNLGQELLEKPWQNYLKKEDNKMMTLMNEKMENLFYYDINNIF